jgi:glycosyltransferase involved in cell wall biosynthesis
VKILLGSHHFFPSTGGIETASNLLAREFVALGHEVRVITQTEGNGAFPFAVVRQPGALELLRQVRWCDLFLQNNISLRTLWPLLFVRRPLFIAHQTWITNSDGSTGWQHRLKRFVLRYATSFAISRAIAEQLPGPSIQVGNPYDDKVFNDLPADPRTKELIFAGRLVSDKGANLLLEAMALLESKPRLTIAGDGPERAPLEKQAADLRLQSQVKFVGSQTSDELAKLLRQHQILVVPSRWQEPFGIVALEGIACGCVVVGSAEGGLAEAIGPCGVTFPNGDARALANALSALLEDPAECDRLRANAAAHLARFTPRFVAGLYLDAMKNASR